MRAVVGADTRATELSDGDIYHHISESLVCLCGLGAWMAVDTQSLRVKRGGLSKKDTRIYLLMRRLAPVGMFVINRVLPRRSP